MAKPHYTFRVVKGKAKVVTEAEDSRKQITANRADPLVNAADYLLGKAKVRAF